MNCPICKSKLEIHRICRKVRMRCSGCKKEYKIHEIAEKMDAETEAKLARFPAIIYD